MTKSVVVLFLLCASASAQGHLHKIGTEYLECKPTNCTCTRYALDYLNATDCVWGAEIGDTVSEVQAAHQRMSQTQARLSGLLGGTTGQLGDKASPIYCITYQRSGVAGGIPAVREGRDVQSLSLKMADAIDSKLGMLTLSSWEEYQHHVKTALQATNLREYLQLIRDTQERLAKLNFFFTNPFTYMATAAPQIQTVSADVNAVQSRWDRLSPEDQRILNGRTIGRR